MKNDSAEYVIIGNSVAAAAAVEGIRSLDERGEILVIGDEAEGNYSRPLLCYWLAGKLDDGRMLYRPAGFFERAGVRVLSGVRAEVIDTQGRVVKTRDGSIRYGKLLIATGSAPIVPEMPNTDAQGVFRFTTWDDARRIREHIGRCGSVSAVIVGGGLIGIKAVEGLVGLGVRPRVVELADRILSATFDETASQLAIEVLARHGVEVLCGTTVREIGCRDGAVEAVELSNGRRLPCDLLILAIGLRPNARLAAEAGIEVSRGIVVDDRMATSAADVWAAGDVAEGTELVDGERRPVATWPSAYSQGIVAGCNMAGGERRHGGSLAMNAVDLCGVAAIGVGRSCPGPEEGCEILSKVDRAAARYRKIVLRDDRIIGAIFVGQIERSGIITGLIQQKIDVSHLKDSLLTDDFGVISLPAEYRKHLVSGPGMLV